MRGKVCLFNLCELHYRITPAYAGKSIYHVRQRLSTKDHPRLCGEKLHFLYCQVPSAGSPPPMRGKAVRAVVVQVRAGITPAYAGKRKLLHLRSGGDRDHPRLCGEKYRSRSFSVIFGGSPPPMRGKVPDTDEAFYQTEDHPRLCGEKPETVRLSRS